MKNKKKDYSVAFAALGFGGCFAIIAFVVIKDFILSFF